MKRIYLLSILTTITFSIFGQDNSMDNYEDKETIYQMSIRELVKDIGDDENIYIVYASSLSQFFSTREIDGRRIIFISDDNEKDEQKKNGNILRIYELEYPKVIHDRIVIKINHMLAFEINLKKDESEWPKKLTEVEKEIARQGIKKSRLLEGGSNAETYSALIQMTWTYITFKLDSVDNEFKFEKKETKTKW